MYNLSQQKGFTLIEVLISVSILSFGLVMLLQGNVRLLNIIRISENTLNALSEAEIKMAEFEIKMKDTSKEIFFEKSTETFESRKNFFVWEIDFLDVPVKETEVKLKNKLNNKLKEVRAEMSWKEGKRKGKLLLHTFIREPLDELDIYGF
ncbi:MAG: type II secretion system protein [Candidatus Omnitrophica bacterium]|nr:type II secretion system protein [Candidatus Omnitrophota bacterium]MCK5492283.1 type II secretion system protein [Candidatus Omnitrophota bacterium]